MDTEIYISKPEQMAVDQATQAGIARVRVWRDGEGVRGTMEIRKDRLNLYVNQNGTVYRASFG